MRRCWARCRPPGRESWPSSQRPTRWEFELGAVVVDRANLIARSCVGWTVRSASGGSYTQSSGVAQISFTFNVKAGGRRSNGAISVDDYVTFESDGATSERFRPASGTRGT